MMQMRTETIPMNDFDMTGQCPDTVVGAEAWDYDESGDVVIDGRTILLDHSVDLQGEGLIIQNGGRLIFKDMGAGTDTITLRAKSIKLHDFGEMWIGSRQCRYQGNADGGQCRRLDHLLTRGSFNGLSVTLHPRHWFQFFSLQVRLA